MKSTYHMMEKNTWKPIHFGIKPQKSPYFQGIYVRPQKYTTKHLLKVDGNVTFPYTALYMGTYFVHNSVKLHKEIASIYSFSIYAWCK